MSAYDQGHWNKQIARTSDVYHHDLMILPQFQQYGDLMSVWGLIKGQLPPDRILLRCYLNGYTYGTDGYAHQDDTWINGGSETCIVYLNDGWNRDFAGETVIYDALNEIEYSVLPKAGRLLIFDSKKFHAARPVSRICNELRTVLVFKAAPPNVKSKEIEFLLKETAGVTHTGRTFFEHLYYTGLNLEKMDVRPAVVAAGYFHSIYGTEYFKPSLNVDRDRIKALIGPEAEKLVWTFCKTPDRLHKWLDETNKMDVQERVDLLCIEYANLTDQNFHNKHDGNLYKIREAINNIKME